jgi:hypothetical protein
MDVNPIRLRVNKKQKEMLCDAYMRYATKIKKHNASEINPTKKNAFFVMVYVQE